MFWSSSLAAPAGHGGILFSRGRIQVIIQLLGKKINLLEPRGFPCSVCDHPYPQSWILVSNYSILGIKMNKCHLNLSWAGRCSHKAWGTQMPSMHKQLFTLLNGILIIFFLYSHPSCYKSRFCSIKTRKLILPEH